MEYIKFWIAKFAVDTALALVVIVLISIICYLFSLRRTFRQWRCRHDDLVYETRACDAICVQCGKNLGFIQKWRDQNSTKQP